MNIFSSFSPMTSFWKSAVWCLKIKVITNLWPSGVMFPFHSKILLLLFYKKKEKKFFPAVFLMTMFWEYKLNVLIIYFFSDLKCLRNKNWFSCIQRLVFTFILTFFLQKGRQMKLHNKILVCADNSDNNNRNISLATYCKVMTHQWRNVR